MCIYLYLYLYLYLCIYIHTFDLIGGPHLAASQCLCTLKQGALTLLQAVLLLCLDFWLVFLDSLLEVVSPRGLRAMPWEFVGDACKQGSG